MMPTFTKLVSHGITVLDIYFAVVGEKVSNHYNISAIWYLFNRSASVVVLAEDVDQR